MGKFYDQYLKSDYWLDKRRKVLCRKKRRVCWICGSKKYLNVHHRSYVKNGKPIFFREKCFDLFVLCSECHGLWHGNFKTLINKNKISLIKELIWLFDDKHRAFHSAKFGDQSRILINSFKLAAEIKRPTKLYELDRRKYLVYIN